MVNPTASEVVARVSGFDNLLLAASTTDRALQQAQTDLRVVREPVAVLCQDLARYLRYQLAHETAITRRAVMRLYGYRFEGEHQPTALPQRTKPKTKRLLPLVAAILAWMRANPMKPPSPQSHRDVRSAKCGVSGWPSARLSRGLEQAQPPAKPIPAPAPSQCCGECGVTRLSRVVGISTTVREAKASPRTKPML